MADRANDPEEEALRRAKEAVSERYEALQAEREALDAELRAITRLEIEELPRWRALLDRRNQKVREVATAAEAEEQAALRWLEHRSARS